MKTIAERKAYLETVIKKTREGKPISWNTLSLAVEGRSTNLLIWIGNEKSIADGSGAQQIHMRLDKFESYSAPLKESSLHYLEKENETIKQLCQFGFISSIDNLDLILEITKNLKVRNCQLW